MWPGSGRAAPTLPVKSSRFTGRSSIKKGKTLALILSLTTTHRCKSISKCLLKLAWQKLSFSNLEKDMPSEKSCHLQEFSILSLPKHQRVGPVVNLFRSVGSVRPSRAGRWVPRRSSVSYKLTLNLYSAHSNHEQ